MSVRGVSSFSCYQDSLHCVEQGPVLRLIGGSLKLLVYHTLPGTPETNLNQVWERIVVCYEQQRTSTRLTNLRLGMFTDTSKPHATHAVLKCKAAEARHLVPIIALLLQGFAAPEFQHARAACECLQSFYMACEAASFVLTDAQANVALDTMTGFLIHYQWLNNWATECGFLCFGMLPKCHYAKHLAEEAKYLHPRLSWTYRAEDFIGKISFMAGSCVHGTRGTKLAKKVLLKYRLYFHFALKWRLHDA